MQRGSPPPTLSHSSLTILNSSSPGRDTSQASEDEADELARIKRMYHNLVQEMKPRKRKSTASISLKRLGRGIPKTVSLFVGVSDLVAQADKYELHKCGELEEEEFEGLDEIQMDELKQSFSRSSTAFKELCRLIPNFQKKIDEASPEDLQDFYAQLQDGATNARGDDVSKLMSRVASWLNKEYPDAVGIPDDTREGRGIHHSITGMLLCPIQYDWNDEEVRNKLRAAHPDFDYTTDICIRAFYRGFKGSIDHPDKGFLQSSLLVKTFKHIFTSPSSAHDISLLDPEQDAENDTENAPPPKKTRRTHTGKKCSKKAVATNLRMTRVTPRTIAYAAVQLALALSDAPMCCIEHNGLNFQQMYEIIIDFFEDLQHLGNDRKKQRQQLLIWWNREVFPQVANIQKTANVRANSMKLLNKA